MTKQLNVVMKAKLTSTEEPKSTVETQEVQKNTEVEEVDFEEMFPEGSGYSFTTISEE